MADIFPSQSTSGKNKVLVSAARLENYDDFYTTLAAVRTLLAPLGGICAFVHPGQKVLLKVNLLSPAAPSSAVTTHPQIVRAMVRLVLDAGAATCLVGDGPGVGTTLPNARACGITEAVEQEGGEITEFKETQLYTNNDNRILKQIDLAKQLQEVDVVISMPKLKTHSQMGFTGALKNQYGLIPGAAKGQFHFRFQNRDRLADLMIDINRIAAVQLAIMDAVVCMEGAGPSGGTPRKMGVLLASTDLSALDAITCAAIHLPLSEVPLSQAAMRADFGTSDLEKIHLTGLTLSDFEIPDFMHAGTPINIMKVLPLPKFMLRWLRRQLAPAPRIDPRKCIHCRRCEKGCPVAPAAIQPEKGKHQVDDSTCIRCYCCHEFCPAKAIFLHKSLLAYLLPLNTIANMGTALMGRLRILKNRFFGHIKK